MRTPIIVTTLMLHFLHNPIQLRYRLCHAPFRSKINLKLKEREKTVKITIERIIRTLPFLSFTLMIKEGIMKI